MSKDSLKIERGNNMKTYLVTYVLKRGGRWEDHEITITAENAKEARKCFDVWWGEKTHGTYKPHTFHVGVKLIRG